MAHSAISNDDVAAILAAARGYFDAFREADPGLIRRHFLPGAAKAGFLYDYERGAFGDLSRHDREQVAAWASTYNASGHMPAGEPELTLLDAQSETAVVRLTAEWAPGRRGVDYVLLARAGGAWSIAALLWQSLV